MALYGTDTGGGLAWRGPTTIDTAHGERTERWQPPTAPETIRTRYEALRGRFANIDKAELRLDHVDWRAADAGVHPAVVHLVVRGTTPDGALAQLDQWARVTIGLRDGQWRFTAEHVNGADRVEDGRGLAIFDYDRDGHLDLLVRNYRQPAVLLRNQGGPHH